MAFLSTATGELALTLKIGACGAIAALVSTVAAAVVMARGVRDTEPRRASKAAPVLGAVLLAGGVAAFWITRSHQRDVERPLPARPTGFAIAAMTDLVTPVLHNARPLRRAPTIGVSAPAHDPAAGVVVLDGSEVAAVHAIVKDSGLAWEPLQKLKERLDVIRENWRITRPGKGSAGRIILQADRSAAGRVIARVLATCHASGFDEVYLATLRTERIESAVLGVLRAQRGYGVRVGLTEKRAGALQIDVDAAFGALARRIDGRAARGKAELWVGRDGVDRPVRRER